MSARSDRLIKTLGVVFLATVMAACSGKKSGDGSDAGGTGGADASAGASASGVEGDGGLTPEEMAARERMLGNVIYFEFDQSSITEESRAKLDALADRVRNDSSSVRLEGHADERGTPEYNLALGERRAKAVANYLALKGIDRSRIETVSYGEERPASLGQDEQSYSANRRVEVK